MITVAIIAAIAQLLIASGTLFLGWHNKKKLEEVHVHVNSRLTELIEARTRADRSEGREEGRVGVVVVAATTPPVVLRPTIPQAEPMPRDPTA